MQDVDLNTLAALVRQLTDRVDRLHQDNLRLRAQELKWREERAYLIDKNEMARQRVESMILRLKALEQD